MKNILKLIVLLASLNLGAQETEDATDFLTGLIVSNATEVTTADSIPVLDGNTKLNTWISAANLLDGLVTGSGTTNYLAKFTAAGTVGDSQIFDDGTNVGIGTATPNHELVVEGSASPNIELKNTNYSNGGFVLNRTNYTQQWKWWAENNVMYFGFATNEANYSSLLSIEQDGKVGIGTETPEAKFEILNTDFPTLDSFHISTSDATPGDVFTVEASTGNVGIGTNTPEASAKLEIESTTQGFLPPRMTAAQKNAISSPAEGLMIYQTDSVKGNYIFDGTNWVNSVGIITGNTDAPNISNGTSVENYTTRQISAYEEELEFTNVPSQNAVALRIAPNFRAIVNGKVGGSRAVNFTPTITYADGTALTYATLVTANYSVASDVVTFNLEVSGVTSNHTDVGLKVTGLPAPLNETTIVNCWLDLTGGTTTSPQGFYVKTGNVIQTAGTSTANLTRFIISGSYIKQ